MAWLLPVAGGFLLDLLLGDPPRLYHPVRLVGALITGLERLLRRVFPATPGGLRAAGAVLAGTVPAVTAGAAWGLLCLAGMAHPGLRLALATWMCYRILAARALQKESMLVYDRLNAGDLPGARENLARIVGRDTAALDAAAVTRAAVETVAENTSDGVIAPLFYLALGGPVLGWCYKAVNTLDSMVGYKDERYRDFGCASARLDDLVNWIPARLSALLMIPAAALTGLDAAGALRIWRRDRRRHPSPNSAQTEAACAGALGVRLAGGAGYGGVWRGKPFLGDDARPVTPRDIPRACRLMLAASVLALLLFAAAVLWINFIS